MEGVIDSERAASDWRAGAIAPCGYDGASASPEDPNKADGQCIKSTDGPVLFEGAGYDQVIGVGVGITFSRWQIPSIGAKGTSVTGGGYIGLGASLGGGGGSVNHFSDFNGDNYRLAGTVTGVVSGEALWDTDGKSAGGGLGAGAGGGLYFGKTRTTIKSSNMPICH
jgi:hypothetical protein